MPPTTPQNARDVVYRALSLGALLKRHEIEMSLKLLNQYIITEQDSKHLYQKLLKTYNKLVEWMAAEKIDSHFTPAEEILHSKPLGTWSSKALMQISWRAETLGMLLWSLRLIHTIPNFDTPFETEEVIAPLDLFNPTIDLVWCAELRPNYELCRMRDAAELWNWRSHASELQRLGIRPSKGVDYREVIRVTGEQALADGILTGLCEGDFSVFGKPYTQMTNDEYELVQTISRERYSVITWVTEITSEWESVTVE
jgi:hypothetical protein